MVYSAEIVRGVFVGLFLLYVGCAEPLVAEGAGSSAEKSSQTPQVVGGVYPVPAQRHLEVFQGAVHDAEPTVLNAVAYARYAAELNGDDAVGQTESSEEIVDALTRQAETSGVDYYDAVWYGRQQADDGEYADYQVELTMDTRYTGGPAGLSRQGRGIIDGLHRVNLCTQDGYSGAACCQALLWVEALAPEVDEADYRPTAGEVMARALAAYQSGERTAIQPFNQANVRSWLAYCGPDAQRAPESIWEFKARFGDYTAGAGWVQELHPISPAKQAGRRIYRRRMDDGTWVSVAESINDDCSVRETETIVVSPGRQALFWVFDHHGDRGSHAYFPTRRAGQDAVRFAPDSCMGCHYTMDTRRFTVPAPSFEALNLKLYEADGEPVWRDHAHCASGTESIIYHDASVIGR